jgi:2,5-diamino-6-(ribosylamino)-4(3H)-pyrimidinone 5'-phosphate reductase
MASSRERQNNRAWILSNLAISIDGKIAPARGPFVSLGTPEDRREMLRVRAVSDAILMGAETLRVFQRPLRAGSAGRGPASQPLNIILSSTLEGVDPSWPFFRAKDITRVLFVSESLSARRLAAFSKNSTVIVLKSAPNPAREVVSILSERYRVRRLLVEGGGGVMALFHEAGLLDELRVTLTPWLLGGKTAPTLVDGKGLPFYEAPNYHLEKCRRVGDELYLTYIKKGKRRSARRSLTRGDV